MSDVIPACRSFFSSSSFLLNLGPKNPIFISIIFICFHLLFLFEYVDSGFGDSIWIKGNTLDAGPNQKGGKTGVIRWRLAADADIFFSLNTFSNHLAYQELHRLVVFIGYMAHYAGIAVKSQDKLC